MTTKTVKTKAVTKATNPMPSLLASSGNPQEISAMVQGVLMSLVPIAIQLMKTQGVEIAQGEAVAIVQAFTATLSFAIMTFGAMRKTANIAKKAVSK